MQRCDPATSLSPQHTTPIHDSVRFSGGNIFGLLVGKITDIVLDWAELIVNGLIDTIESIVCGLFGCRIPRVCLTGGDNVYRCEHTTDQNNLQWLLGCGFRATTAEAQRCYFARQRSICMDGDPSRYNRYQKLFEAPPKAELEESFWEIAGSTFDAVPPTLNAAFNQLQKESSNDVWTDAAKNLCDANLWDTMDIDEIIVSSHPSNNLFTTLRAQTVCLAAGVHLQLLRGILWNTSRRGQVQHVHPGDKMGITKSANCFLKPARIAQNSHFLHPDSNLPRRGRSSSAGAPRRLLLLPTRSARRCNSTSTPTPRVSLW